jgi:hypothetical protein
MHLVDFFVLQRGNNVGSDGLFAFERDTPKDVVFLGLSQEIWVLTRWGHTVLILDQLIYPI